MITLIAAIGCNNELGYNNSLPWKISEDMIHFKNYTMGKVIIMGSNTFASIGNKSLPGRKCIVVTSQDLGNRAIQAKSIESALSINHCYPEIVIIGGASIYEQTINLADKLVITHINSDFIANVFFPEINLNIWEKTLSRNSKNEHFDYEFAEYMRRH